MKRVNARDVRAKAPPSEIEEEELCPEGDWEYSFLWKFSVQERINYYEMLTRMRRAKKVRKKMRQSARHIDIGVEANGVSTYMDEIFEKISSYFYPDNKGDDNVAIIKRDFKEAIMKGLRDKQSPFNQAEDEDSIWSKFQGMLPSNVDLPWLGYLVVMFVSLYRSRSRIDDILILTQYVIALKLTSRSMDVLNLVLPILATHRMFFRKSPSEVEIRTEAMSDILLDNRSLCADFISSHFMMSIREIVLIMASYHLFPKKIASQLYLWLGKTDKPKSLPEAMSKITVDLGNLLRMGESIQKGNPISEVFLTSDPVLSTKRKCVSLKYQYNFLYFGLPTPDGVDAKTWVRDVAETLLTIKKFEKTVNPYDLRLKELTALGLDLTTRIVEVKSKTLRSRRATPYFAILCGMPGIGKSSILTWLCQLWSLVKGRTFNQNQVFEKNPKSEYYDGYNPFETPIIHMSEIGNLMQKMAEAGLETGPFELTSIVDSLPYNLNMSDVKDKGVTYCMPEMVCVDTNFADMNLKHMVKNVAAYKRRAIYIQPKVKPEYRVSETSCALDANKTGEDFMDKWTFEVYRCVPISNDDSKDVFLMEGEPKDDIYRLFEVLKEDMEKHVAKEEAVLKRTQIDWVANYASRQVGTPLLEAEMQVLKEVDDAVQGGSFSSLMDEKEAYAHDHNIQLNSFADLFGDVRKDISNVRCESLGEKANEWKEKAKKQYDEYVAYLNSTAFMKNFIGEKFQDDGIPIPPLHDDAQIDPNVVDYCECCPFGFHQPDKNEKMRLFIVECFRNVRDSIIACLWFLLAYACTLPDFIQNGEDYLRFLFAIIQLILLYFIPYYWVVILLFSMIALCYYGFIKMLEKGGKEVKKMVIEEVKREAATALDNTVKFFRRNQTKAIQFSTAVVALYALSKVIPWVYGFTKKDKKRVESAFKTDLPIYREAEETEQLYGMKTPGLRIKTMRKAMTYENTISLVDRPVATNGTLADFYSTVTRNARPVRCLTFYDGQRFKQETFGFGVCGTDMLVPMHLFNFEKALKTELHICPDRTRRDVADQFIYSIVLDVLPSDVIPVACDMGLIRISGTQFRDIICHFPTEVFPVKNLTCMIDEAVVNSDDVPEYEVRDDVFDRILVHKTSIGYHWANHRPGSCGYPVVGSVTGGYFIVGLHIAGSFTTAASFAVKLSQYQICQARNKLNETSIERMSRTESAIIECDVPESRSFTRFIEAGPVEIHGKVSNFNGNQDSNIVKSIFGSDPEFENAMFDILPEVVTTQYVPASMRPTKKGSPITNGAIKLCKERLPVDKTVMKKVIQVISDKLISNLDDLKIGEDYTPIDIETVLNGSRDDYLSRPVDVKKGGGFGYPGKKKNHLYVYEECIEDEIVRKYEPGKNLLEDVMSIIHGYEDGKSCNPIFKAALKDELRSMEKMLSHKTRVFYATPFPFLIVHKAFLSPLYTLMVEHGIAFYAALGVDMHRYGHKIKERLIEFCTLRGSKVNCLEGDYGGFDTSMPYEIGEAACEITHLLCKRLGYKPEVMHIVIGILTDLLFPRVDFFGDLLSVAGLQPSGKYATAEDNSLRNLIIMVYVWYCDALNWNLNFFDYVLPTTYGDDLLAAVLDEVADRYNNITMARVCATIGLEFTTSQKGDVTEPFIDLDKISFLKRTFAYHDGVKREVSRLSIDSIYKMLQYIDPAKAVGPQVQYDGICRSALIEFFFWSTESEYNKMYNYISLVLSRHYPKSVFDFPTYEKLCADYMENSATAV